MTERITTDGAEIYQSRWLGRSAFNGTESAGKFLSCSQALAGKLICLSADLANPRSLRAALPEIYTPVLSIWGAHDPLVPPENSDLLNRGLPRTRSVVLESGHSAWEDRAEEYAATVLDWIRGGYRTA